MSWRDRPYADDDGGGWSRQGGGISIGLPKPTRVVTYLLIINITVFVLTAVSGTLRGFLSDHFMMSVWEVRSPLDGTLLTGGGVLTGHFWRLVTYQYFHDTGSAFHLFFNMLGLYFLGTPLESRWGPKTFLAFYTVCGVAGAVLFTAMVAVGILPNRGMVGASGSVLGLLAACAVLMPQFTIILLFFPVPIRVAAVLLVAIYVLNLLTAFAGGHPGAGGDAAHLGGMAFGAAWCLWGWAWLERRREHAQLGAWERKVKHRQELQREADRILAKIHEHGIGSLTRREKQTLADATEAQRRDEQRARHP